MAEIEKGLPGETRTQVKVPAEDIEIKEEVQQEKPPVEVIPEEDGGATIDFEPGAITYLAQKNILTILQTFYLMMF